MHIQEGTNTTLTTCTKMTEEVDRRHGVNGNSSSKAVSEDVPVHSSTPNATGGRLKFFKDGKFILELVRGCAREGERAGWVSVPRKTFWPPAGAPAPAPPPQALSLSDDNSSVHSSPWQRDHCWKQPAPRKNLSAHRALYYCRPGALPAAAIAAAARAKRRRPLDAAPPPAPPNGVRRNGDCAEPRADDDDRDLYYRVKLKKPPHARVLRVYRKTRAPPRRGELARVVARLAERAAAAPPVHQALASCRHEHALVSPRKRILRELERVSLEEASGGGGGGSGGGGGGKRRARPAPALSTASFPPAAGPSRAPPPAASPARHVGSYSIHSLLSMRDDSPTPEPKRSPSIKTESQPPSIKTESPASVTSPAPSPSPAEAPQWRAPYAAYGARGWPAPAAAAGAGYRGRDEWLYPYHYPYVSYRAPPAPLWMQYAVGPAPPPWPPLPLPLLTEHMPADEHTADLPLNLSKH